MADGNGSIKANLVATPPVKDRVNKSKGRLRIFQSTYTVPASGGPGVGETITWGSLPKGANVLGHLSQLSFSAGAASSTLNLGDAASAARHLAATAVNSAGVAVPQVAQAAGAEFQTSDDSTDATNDCELISTVAGAALGAGQVITLRMVYTLD